MSDEEVAAILKEQIMYQLLRSPSHSPPSSNVFLEAKQSISIPEAWNLLEFPGQPGKICCSPFREDSNPSFSIYDHGRRWKDHGSGEGGDVIEFLKHGLGGGYSSVRSWLLMRSLPVSMPAHKPSVVGSVTHQIKWPAPFKAPRPKDLDDFARSRGLSTESTREAVQAGILKFLEISGVLCFAVTDPENRAGEIRRIDKALFDNGSKVYGLSGVDKSWMVGASRLGKACEYTRVLLVEGATDLLTAFHLLSAFRKQDASLKSHWIPVALLGASCRRLAPNCAELLRGRHVRVVPDADDAGDAMLYHWTSQLTKLGCAVDSVSLDRGRDLSDMVETINPKALFA